MNLEDLFDIELLKERAKFQQIIDMEHATVFPKELAKKNLDRVIKEMERRVKK